MNAHVVLFASYCGFCFSGWPDAGTRKEELAAAVEAVATRNFCVVFDYVVKPEVPSKFPVPFKEEAVRCFISWWENVNLTEKMLSQTEGIWISPASPAGVKACLSQGRDLLANDASTGGVTPFVDAVLRSSYFHFHIFHRLRVVMRAAGTYLSLLRPSETRLSDLELQDLTASIRKLTAREFKGIIRKIPAFSLISYSIVAAETGRSLVVLEAPARSMHAGTLIRIGHQPRGLRRLLRRRKINLVCAPDCHVVPKPIKLERNLTAGKLHVLSSGSEDRGACLHEEGTSSMAPRLLDVMVLNAKQLPYNEDSRPVNYVGLTGRCYDIRLISGF